MVDFGTFRGDQILGQALHNIAATQTAKVNRAEDAERQNAYLKIQQTHADSAKANQLYNNFVRGREMEKLHEADATRDFVNQWLPKLEVKDSPLTFDDGFFSDSVMPNAESKNVYITQDSKDGVWEDYAMKMNARGVAPDRAKFEQMFQGMLGTQAASITRKLKAFRSQYNPSDEAFQRALDKTPEGGILQQAIIQGSDGDPMSLGYIPRQAQVGGDGYDTSRIAATAFLGLRAGKAVQQGRALAVAGKGSASMNTLKSLTGVSGLNKLARVAKIASTEQGRAHLMSAVAKKKGPAFAAKFMAKLGAKSTAGAVMASTGVGAIGSAALTMWTLYDIYDIIDEIA